jgi:hypothetical protein
LATPRKTHPHLFEGATLKRVASSSVELHPVATPSELRQNEYAFFTQGFKANAGLKLANAFSVIY